MRTWCLPLLSIPLLACSSSSGKANGSVDAGAAVDSGDDSSGAVGTVVEHGVMADYFTLKPIAGLTVTDNNVSTVTGADGKWSLTVPANALLQATIVGPKYTELYFPDSSPTAPDIDFGTAVAGDSASYSLEQNSVNGFDPTKALVHLVLVPTGSCTSVVGGTAKVLSPAGATLTYFATAGIPQDVVTSIQDVKPPRPIAVVFNIDPGADLVVQIDHPTCKQVAFPAAHAGRTYSGHVRTKAAEPGDFNSALVIIME